VVRLGINPMIQPEPEDLPKDNPKLEIAVLSDADAQTFPTIRVSLNSNFRLICHGGDIIQHPSDTNVFTMKMEILFKPASTSLGRSKRLVNGILIPIQMLQSTKTYYPRSSRFKDKASPNFDKASDNA
ncbi:hypothetical protein Tco_0476041, partial [Tanacetum coccineum]